MSDSTFKILKETDLRSTEYQCYRKEWERRGKELDPSLAPLHLDLEVSCICDLRCGSSEEDPKGFCNVWAFETVRTQGFKDKTYRAGLMNPVLFYRLLHDAADLGVRSVKLNFRGEPTLHPEILNFVYEAHGLFDDVMINTNGNGGARKDPLLFGQLVYNGVTNLMFSVDACDEVTYLKQRRGGDWQLLLQSVKSAIAAKKYAANSDCRIRASVVRTQLNKDDVDSGRMQDFWVGEVGVDWLSVSECYPIDGQINPWMASEWCLMTAEEFQCSDPFRRMIITWDGLRTFFCCHSYSGEIDGGPVISGEADAILQAWHSPIANKLRNSHIARTWYKDQPICTRCPLRYKPTQIG